MENNKDNRNRVAKAVIDQLTSDQIKDLLIDRFSRDLQDDVVFKETVNKVVLLGDTFVQAAQEVILEGKVAVNPLKQWACDGWWEEK